MAPRTAAELPHGADGSSRPDPVTGAQVKSSPPISGAWYFGLHEGRSGIGVRETPHKVIASPTTAGLYRWGAYRRPVEANSSITGPPDCLAASPAEYAVRNADLLCRRSTNNYRWPCGMAYRGCMKLSPEVAGHWYRNASEPLPPPSGRSRPRTEKIGRGPRWCALRDLASRGYHADLAIGSRFDAAQQVEQIKGGIHRHRGRQTTPDRRAPVTADVITHQAGQVAPPHADAAGFSARLVVPAHPRLLDQRPTCGSMTPATRRSGYRRRGICRGAADGRLTWGICGGKSAGAANAVGSFGWARE